MVVHTIGARRSRALEFRGLGLTHAEHAILPQPIPEFTLGPARAVGAHGRIAHDPARRFHLSPHGAESLVQRRFDLKAQQRFLSQLSHRLAEPAGAAALSTEGHRSSRVPRHPGRQRPAPERFTFWTLFPESKYTPSKRSDQAPESAVSTPAPAAQPKRVRESRKESSGSTRHSVGHSSASAASARAGRPAQGASSEAEP